MSIYMKVTYSKPEEGGGAIKHQAVMSLELFILTWHTNGHTNYQQEETLRSKSNLLVITCPILY